MGEQLIGGHVSAAGGVMKAFENAHAIGANFVQIFTQSPRAWKTNAIADEEIAHFKQGLADQSNGLKGLVTHASYLINLASADRDLFNKSQTALIDNLESASKLGARGVVLHVGSHKGLGLGSSLGGIISSLKCALESVDNSCQIFLENTAGQGGSVGVTFEELARIIDGAGSSESIGVCLDTQHLFASGVSYSTIEEADSVIKRFAEILGISRLGCVHLNDSKTPLGSMKDRHENLAEGLIGADALSNLMSHPALLGVPVILETPGDGKGPRRRDVELARDLIAKGQSRRGG